jgi:hypothetical protein
MVEPQSLQSRWPEGVSTLTALNNQGQTPADVLITEDRAEVIYARR